MNMLYSPKVATVLLSLFTLLVCNSTALAQSSAFTYQGSLNDNGSPANGFFDIFTELWDAPSGGAPVGTAITNNAVEVVDGVFTVTLDFGAGVFDGSDRWLEIGVVTNGGGAFSTLSPRQEIVSAPYAITAASLNGVVSESSLAGTYGELISLTNAADQLSGTFSGDGAGLSGIHSLDASDGSPVDAVFVNKDGRVGIGVTSPSADLHIRGNSANGLLTVTPNVANSQSQLLLAENTSGTLGMILRYAGNESSNPLHIIGLSGGGESNPLLTVERNTGNVGIGTNSPSARLHVDSTLALGSTLDMRASESGTDGADLRMRDAAGVTTVNVDAQQSGGGSQIDLYNDVGTRTVRIDSDEIDSGKIQLFDSNGVAVISIDADSSLGGSLVQAQIMQITGGSDIAEPFEIHGATTQPGLVVSIDPDRPGELVDSTTEYDRKVAGIVSGAGGVRPGLTLSQEGSVADGSHPVALSGRVYCWVDADLSGGVAPGDLLTTSSTPGHAMKVREAMRAQGAIIGKAMSRLEGGRGLVLVLVALQ